MAQIQWQFTSLCCVTFFYICTHLAVATAELRTDCKLNLRSDTVGNSWQSSSALHNGYVKICFLTHSIGRRGHFEFLHTKVGSRFANAGYHWLAIRLKQLTNISSVTIQNRESPDNNPILNSRASDIEVWTSAVDSNFGTDSCEASSVSEVFQRSINDWTRCGATPHAGGISSGMDLTVNCNQMNTALMLLMRKRAETSDSCMSFVNLWINRFDVQIKIQPPRPVSVTEQSPGLTVTCQMLCLPDNQQPGLRLCLPDGSCLSSSQHKFMGRLRPQDAGRFDCRFHGQTVSSAFVSVLYPPSDLSIEWLEDSGISTDGQVTVYFAFETSASKPIPRHNCSVAGGHQVIEEAQVMRCDKRVSPDCSDDSNVGSGGLRSRWVVSVNLLSRMPAVHVTCTAAHGSVWSKSVRSAWLLPQQPTMTLVSGAFRLVILSVAIATACGMAVGATVVLVITCRKQDLIGNEDYSVYETVDLRISAT